MRSTLRSLTLGLAASLGLTAMAQQPYGVYVYGHINPCSPAISGGAVTISPLPGTQSVPGTQTVTLNENCFYTAFFEVTAPDGGFTVTGSCGNGTADTEVGQFADIEPGFTTDLMIDLNCGTEPTTYTVTVTGHVEGCPVINNWVTVRCTSCTPMVDVNAPVDANCNYTGVLVVEDMQGTIVAATGCTNGSVPNNTTQYIVNPGQPGTQVSLWLSCEPDPNQACFTVEGTAPFTAIFTNCTVSNCSGPFEFTWDFQDSGTEFGDQVTHTFPGPGTYAVCLNVLGADNCTNHICQEVVVGEDGTINPTNDPCEAGFWVMQGYEGDPSTGGTPIPYELWIWNLSSGGTGLFQFQWSFGDGTGSNEAFPTHTYSGTGPYELCLTITDSEGCTDDYCESISVDEDGLYNGMIGGGDDRSTLTINVRQPLSTGVQENALSELTVWPNPVADVLTINLASDMEGNVPVTVLDANGREVITIARPMVDGNNRFTVPTAELTPGMYLLRVGSGNDLVVRRFVKTF